MFITRTRTVRLVTPFALAGVLLLAGCSAAGSATDEDVATVEETTDDSVEPPYTDNLFASDDALNESLAALSERLDAAAPDLAGVGVSYYGDTVNIALVVHDENETPEISATDLRAVLDELAAFDHPGAAIVEWDIDAWDVNGWTVSVVPAAKELALDPAFIDEEWESIVIPADAMRSV